MTEERWKNLWRHFEALVKLPAGQRLPELEALAQQDHALAFEIRQLLAAHDSGTSPLDLPPVEFSASPKPILSPGTKIGAWRLDQLIGQGGMGEVWRGARQDGEFEQQVAIKFPTLANSDLHRARFESERQTLARMNHAHIARLFDGGTTDSGQPYLVMEWIDGKRITDYCKDASLRAKIEVLLPICQAVDYSHRRLVLHRDIKPGNILVNADGTAKLVDFGIAKTLSGIGQSADQTQTALAFTPDYAAPEQIRGEPVGTPADVHALGAVLYELLTGQKPFNRSAKSLAEIIEDTTTQSPGLPSQQIQNRPRESRELKGDLDRIILKALHRDPERRYTTAAGLADDLRNWLEGRPVTARKDSTSYRLQMFARRHPLGVLATSTGLAAVIALIVALSLQAERLREALLDAQSQTVRAQTVSNFLEDLFRQANPQNHGGKQPDLTTLLSQGIDQIDLASLTPDISGQLKQTMGRTLVDLGEIASGRETLLEALQELTPDQVEQRAQTLANLALTENLAHNLDQAIIYQRQAMTLQEQIGNELQIRSGKAQLGVILRKQGDRKQARALMEEALLGLSDEGDQATRVELASARFNLGSVYWGDGDFVSAQQQYELAHETLVSIFGERHARTASSLHALGVVHLAQGNYERSEQYLVSAAELSMEVLGEIHQQTARTQSSLGSLYYDMGRIALASEQHTAALRAQEQLFGENSIRISGSLNNLALVEHDLGRFDSAEHLYQRSMTLSIEEFGEQSERLIAPLINLALLAIDRDQITTSFQWLARAAEIATSQLDADHPSHAFIAHLQGRAYLASNQSDAAIERLTHALSLRRKIGDGRHPHAADTLVWLTRAQYRTGAVPAVELITWAEEAYQISRDKRGPEDWRTLDYQITLGRLLSASGENKRGHALESEGLSALVSRRGMDDWRVLNTWQPERD